MSTPSIPEVTVADVPADAVLLDVRENDEWAAGRAPGAVHVPMTEIAAAAGRGTRGRSGLRHLPVRRSFGPGDRLPEPAGLGLGERRGRDGRPGRRPAGRWSPTATPPPRSSDARHVAPPRPRPRPSNRCADDDRPRLRPAGRPPAAAVRAVRTVPASCSRRRRPASTGAWRAGRRCSGGWRTRRPAAPAAPRRPATRPPERATSVRRPTAAAIPGGRSRRGLARDPAGRRRRSPVTIRRTPCAGCGWLSAVTAVAALVAAGAEIWRFVLMLEGRTLVLSGASSGPATCSSRQRRWRWSCSPC